MRGVTHFTEVRGGGLPAPMLHKALTEELREELDTLAASGTAPRNVRDAARAVKSAMLAGRMDKEALGVIAKYLHNQRTPNRYGK